MSTRVVDSHLHVWDLQRSAYSWLGPQHGELYRSFSPDDAEAVLREAGISSAVLVQAEDSEADTELMLAAAEKWDFVAGVVGWVQLDDPDTAAAQLSRYGEQPAFRGVRHLVHDDPRDDFLELTGVRRSLALLSERGLPFDVPDAWPRHLTRLPELADALPDLVLVVDHLGKPPRGSVGAGCLGVGVALRRGTAEHRRQAVGPATTRPAFHNRGTPPRLGRCTRLLRSITTDVRGRLADDRA